MSSPTMMTEEKLSILASSWKAFFQQLHNEKVYVQRFIASVPSLKNASPTEVKSCIKLELFDLCAYMDMDHTMLRFLRARKFNQKDALAMLWDALLWRKRHDIRRIMQAGETQLRQDLVNAGMYFIWGRDTENRPIVFLNFGNFLVTKCQRDIDEFRTFLIYQMETARFFIGDAGVMALGNLTDFGRKNIDMEFTKVFAQMFQSYYPESLGRATIVGTGLKMALFETVWGVAKYLLDPEVRKKVSFAKPKEVSQYMALKYVPKSLGGEFDEHILRATAPLPTEPSIVDTSTLDKSSLAELETFETAIFGSSEREASKSRLRDFWHDLAKTRPKNLYQRIGLLMDNGQNWDRV